MTDIRAGFFSLTSGAVDGDDAGYLRWHLLDHLPEQYSLSGIRLGTRWRADDACVALRLAAEDGLDAARHAVSYLITDPVADTLNEFGRLGRQLAEAGRYPVAATPLLLGAFELVDARAAPAAVVSAAPLPFRPHRGVDQQVERVRRLRVPRRRGPRRGRGPGCSARRDGTVGSRSQPGHGRLPGR